MAMSYEELYFTPPVFFFAALEAFVRHDENKQKQLYEIIRMHSATILNSFTKRKLRPEDVMRFPWDTAPRRRSREELLADPVLQSWARNPPKRFLNREK